MSGLSVSQKLLTASPAFVSRFGKYGFLFFFLKGILWLLGAGVIYVFH